MNHQPSLQSSDFTKKNLSSLLRLQFQVATRVQLGAGTGYDSNHFKQNLWLHNQPQYFYSHINMYAHVYVFVSIYGCNFIHRRIYDILQSASL